MVAAVLHFARDVLIPLALAVLLAFLLAPAARRLERLHLGRLASTLGVVALGFAVIGAVGWVAADQAVSVAARLPEYRENIALKIRELRRAPEGALSRAAEAIKELESEAGATAGAARGGRDARHPARGDRRVGRAGRQALRHRARGDRLHHPHAAASREHARPADRRDRRGAHHVTTQAMGEAAARVSRFLFMQLVINACFGIPFGIALHVIGIPNALLWGLLATLLRFIPYAGVWIAVALPALLAVAIDADWSMLAWTLGTFFLLELVLVNIAEPVLYGRSAGLSAMAVILAAIFWTWLWGPIGLLLAMPLTVCLTVVGRHVPQLAYFNTLLGVEPVLAPEARFYQRLVALDQEEATELAETYAAEKGAQALLADVVIPALSLAERDRHHGELDARRERFLFDTVGGIVEEIEFENKVNERACVIPAHDEADLVAAQILARASGARLAANVDEAPCPLVCISAVPPHAASHAASLARRLRRRQPEARILVALWASDGDASRAIERLRQAGADQVVTRLPEAIEALKA